MTGTLQVFSAGFALAFLLSGCSGSDGAQGQEGSAESSSASESSETQNSSEPSSDGGAKSQQTSAEGQNLYGCRLADKVKTDFPDAQAWTDDPPEFGVDRVLSELMSIGTLFGGGAPMSDPVDQELNDVGRELVGGANTLKRDEFATLVDSTIDACRDYLSTNFNGDPSATDTSERGQIVYGCRNVEKTLETYPDEAAWDAKEPKFGEDNVANEVMAAGSLFGAGGGGTSEPVDAELERIGSELINGGSTLDTERLAESLDEAREACSSFSA